MYHGTKDFPFAYLTDTLSPARDFSFVYTRLPFQFSSCLSAFGTNSTPLLFLLRVLVVLLSRI